VPYSPSLQKQLRLKIIKSVISIFKVNELPKLVWWRSNLLFTGVFKELFTTQALKAAKLLSERIQCLGKAYAGENWDQFVAYCTERNWGGIENLCLFREIVGACPIQNIGALWSRSKRLY
jgi:UDP-N-acetylmuramate dehydrogenase